MTINPYVVQFQKAYPDTYIGFMAYLNRICNNDPKVLQSLLSANTYTINAYIIGYLEYRGVSVLEATCNTHYDNPDVKFNALLSQTIINTLGRLEKNIIPVEGHQF